MLASYVSIVHTLSVDTFDISGSGGADTTASAGKYISDDVFLEVQQGQTGSGVNWTYDY